MQYSFQGSETNTVLTLLSDVTHVKYNPIPQFFDNVGIVEDVIDGDTYDIKVLMSEIVDHEVQKCVKVIRIRLLGVDTPELHPKVGTEEEKAIEVRAATQVKAKIVKSIKGSIVKIPQIKADKYNGRFVAEILVPIHKYKAETVEIENTFISLADWIIQNNYGVSYDGTTKKKFDPQHFNWI